MNIKHLLIVSSVVIVVVACGGRPTAPETPEKPSSLSIKSLQVIKKVEARPDLQKRNQTTKACTGFIELSIELFSAL